MSYRDVLRIGGWLDDPGDRVRVEAEHAAGCPAALGRACRCTPRLVLREVATPRSAAAPPRGANAESRAAAG